MLSDSQLFRIQDILACLALYANSRFDLVDEEELCSIEDLDDPRQFGIVCTVMQTLWDNVDIIDDFAKDNPYDLPKDELRLALTWKDSLHAMAIFIGVEDGLELYFVQDRIIGIEQSEIRGKNMEVVDMVFLPFEGGISEDFHGILVTDRFDPSMIEDWDTEVAKARRAGIITTESDFVSFSREVNRERRDAEIDKLLADAERESRSRAGEDISPNGFHRGALAGLSFEERERVMEEQAKKGPFPDMLDTLMKEVGKGPVKKTLSECLMSRTKDYLMTLARGCNLSRYSSLRKEELAQKIADEVLNADFRGDTLLEAIVHELPSVNLERLKELIAQGKVEKTDEQAARAIPPFFPHPPLTFMYHSDGVFTLVMPDDVRSALKKIDYPKLEAEILNHERAVKAIEEAVDVYGVISLEEAYEELELLGSVTIPYEEFRLMVYRESARRYNAYDLWFYEGTTYLVQWAITDEAAKRSTPPQTNIDDVLLSMYEDDDLHAIKDKDELIQALTEKIHTELKSDASSGRDMLEEVKEERVYILNCQREHPRKHLYEFDKEGKVFDSLISSHAADRLASYINERIPDNEQDYFFADSLVNQLIIEAVQRNADVGDLLAIACERGLDGCDDDPQRLLGLLNVLCNSLPSWELNGWSSLEQYEMATGHKLFFDDYGMPKKIGRNDPCPCGSGKKYKKCCGR